MMLRVFDKSSAMPEQVGAVRNDYSWGWLRDRCHVYQWRFEEALGFLTTKNIQNIQGIWPIRPRKDGRFRGRFSDGFCHVLPCLGSFYGRGIWTLSVILWSHLSVPEHPTSFSWIRSFIQASKITSKANWMIIQYPTYLDDLRVIPIPSPSHPPAPPQAVH